MEPTAEQETSLDEVEADEEEQETSLEDVEADEEKQETSLEDVEADEEDFRSFEKGEEILHMPEIQISFLYPLPTLP